MPATYIRLIFQLRALTNAPDVWNIQAGCQDGIQRPDRWTRNQKGYHQYCELQGEPPVQSIFRSRFLSRLRGVLALWVEGDRGVL